MRMENPNLPWCQIFVAELARAGLTAVVISPGSRSTPLALACLAQPEIRLYRHLDERGAAYFALGLALATDAPVALVCTSGTAVANYLPAVVEAKMSQVPLLLLTGDRPPELRHSGANQTIDQIKLFGDQVLWFVDAPLPVPDGDDLVLRHLRTLAARAYHTANGLVKGPVHINFPFRKPLEPAPAEREAWFHLLSAAGQAEKAAADRELAPVRLERGQMAATPAQMEALRDLLQQHRRGLIVCGPRCPGGDFPPAVAALSRAAGYPILADPLSGLRWGAQVAETAVAGGYEMWLQQPPPWPDPELILRFGAVPTSKWLNAYLERIRPAHRLHIRENGLWADDGHQTTWLLQVAEAPLCRALAEHVPPRADAGWAQQVMAVETAVWQALDEALAGAYFDGAIVAEVVQALPPSARLFVGNSLPIRHLDQYGRPGEKEIQVFGNRGASGIDGNISTALGIGANGSRPLFAVVGDITFLHDLGGLLAARELEALVTVMVINNNGGHIFQRLPVAGFEPPFTDLFVMPHHLQMEGAAQMMGWQYDRVESRPALAAALAQPVSSTPRLIEVITDGGEDEAWRRTINQQVTRQLARLD